MMNDPGEKRTTFFSLKNERKQPKLLPTGRRKALASAWRGGRGSVPAVVEGGPGRCQRQTLAELIPLPGHLAQLEQDSVQAVAGLPVVVDGWGRGGRLAVHGRACNGVHIRSVCIVLTLAT